jgi:hypothetical protein
VAVTGNERQMRALAVQLATDILDLDYDENYSTIFA